jgi:hypothetical protein
MRWSASGKELGFMGELLAKGSLPAGNFRLASEGNDTYYVSYEFANAWWNS